MIIFPCHIERNYNGLISVNLIGPGNSVPIEMKEKLQITYEKEISSKTSSAKKYNHYQNSSNKYSEFYKRKLREKMNNLFKGSAEDKLKALNLAEELADKSTLPILRKGLKEMNLQIVERSADLIRKFK